MKDTTCMGTSCPEIQQHPDLLRTVSTPHPILLQLPDLKICKPTKCLLWGRGTWDNPELWTSVVSPGEPSFREHTDRCKRVSTHAPGSPKSFLGHSLLGRGLGEDHSPHQPYLLSQKFSTNGAFVDDFTLKTGREVNLKLLRHLETNDSPNLITAHICTPASSDSDLFTPCCPCPDHSQETSRFSYILALMRSPLLWST